MVTIAKNAAAVAKLLKIDTDDGDVAKNQEVQVVINLNYVWDAVGEKWVRMTQP